VALRPGTWTTSTEKTATREMAGYEKTDPARYIRTEFARQGIYAFGRIPRAGAARLARERGPGAIRRFALVVGSEQDTARSPPKATPPMTVMPKVPHGTDGAPTKSRAEMRCRCPREGDRPHRGGRGLFPPSLLVRESFVVEEKT